MNKNAQAQDAYAKAEAERARKAIAAELKSGSPEAQIREFFKGHGWSFGFDKDERCFYSNIYSSQEGDIDVIVDIYVNEKNEFIRSDVKVHYTSF